MIPSSFHYLRPRSAAQAAAMLAERGGEARLLGGGTWVVPELSRGESAPSAVIDLTAAGLDEIAVTGDELRLGAMVTYADLVASEVVAARVPLLALVADGITGGWALRNQATIGGSVAAARPSSDIPGALVALEADALVQGADGMRRVAVADLITGAMRTTLHDDELVAGFALPLGPVGGAGYYKLKRGASSWPIVCASALISVRGGVCARARLVLGGAAAAPVVVDIDDVLPGRPVTTAAIEVACARAAAATTEWWEDALAPAEYRAATATPVARRALSMACESEGRSLAA